jgi:Ca2+-binding RTX toxin-like protein
MTFNTSPYSADKTYSLNSGVKNLFHPRGHNTIYGSNRNDTIHGSHGNDTIYGNNGNDTIYGNSGDDILYGGNGNDTIYGGNGNDTIYGNHGDDILYGGNGNDNLSGGHGNDILVGGTGNDTLTGGAGCDTFRFTSNGVNFGASNLGVDTITDFSSNEDKISLSKATFSQLHSSIGDGFNVFTDFAVVSDDTAAAESHALIVYNCFNGSLFYNENGSSHGFGDGGQFAEIKYTALTSSNFTIVA